MHGHATLFDSKLKQYLLPFNNRYSHDWWLAYVAFNLGKVTYIDKILVHYRQHQSSVTDTLKLQQRESLPFKPVKGIDRILPDLELMKYCAEFKHNRDAKLMNEAFAVFSALAQGRERLRAFLFIVRYYDLLFYMRFKPKNLLSNLNMARKICFE